MNTFAQNDEDIFVYNYFGGYVGNVLSIGENDGVMLSNSRLLILNGWSAYLVEPGDTYADLFKLYGNNPKVHTYNFGIGNKEETVKFYQSGSHIPNGVDRGLVSTTSLDETKRWPDVKFTETEILLVPFDKFYGYIGKQFDFISIDAEGYDWAILQQIDLDKVGCSCICIEHNGHESLIKSYRECCEDRYGMKQGLINGENIIFVR